MSETLFVANISHLTQTDVEDYFRSFGDVKGVNIVAFKDGRAKGYGFVQMGSLRSAVMAVERGSGTLVKGRHIKIEYSGDRSNLACPYEKQGFCFKGDKCDFQHSHQADELDAILRREAENPLICYDFLRGNCFRFNCKYMHNENPYEPPSECATAATPHGRFSRGRVASLTSTRAAVRSRSRS